MDHFGCEIGTVINFIGTSKVMSKLPFVSDYDLKTQGYLASYHKIQIVTMEK